LPELDNYQIITDYCIGADGRVDSVKLYSEVPLDKIEAITLDYQSRSSITLTKVLTKFFWKLNVQFMDGKPGFENKISGTNAGVIIGDRTFSLNGSFKYEYDLSEEWKKYTGLPFVFAAWVSTTNILPGFVAELNEALRFGIGHTDEAINSEASNFPAGFDPAEYLRDRIDYKLDAKKLEALALFLDYIGKL
jgi:chorismate dehydratase